MNEIAIREGAALEQQQHSTLFRTDSPVEVVARASEMANELAKVVKKQKLTTKIQGRDHVRVEGWTLLGTMLGVFPVLVWTRKVAGPPARDYSEEYWEARVEARTIDGRTVGAAEAMCSRSEKTWANRDDYALRSMAQTRATSKALRQPLGFVMTLAGFDATPAEEMTFDADYTVADVPAALAPNPDEHPDRGRVVTELLNVAEKLGKRDEKEQQISRSRAMRAPADDMEWLRNELAKGKRALAAQEKTT